MQLERTLHRSDHLAAALVKSHAAQEVARADNLLGDVRSAEERADRLYAAAEGILTRAMDVEDLNIALGAIRTAVSVMSEGRRYLELRGDLTGELGKRNSTPARYTIMSLPNFYEAPLPEPTPQNQLPPPPGPSGEPIL